MILMCGLLNGSVGQRLYEGVLGSKYSRSYPWYPRMSSHRMNVFEGDGFSGALELDIFVNGMAIKNAIRITQ